jgi:virginiamycin A acetyltransferase
MPGVEIGHGAIIAAESVVRRIVTPYAIAGGSPATVTKRWFADEVINALLSLSWWDRPLDKITRNLHAIPGADLYALRQAV